MSIFKPNNQLGYTLTEVLIVMFLLGLMTSLTGPAIERVFPFVAMNAMVETVNADLGSARRLALRNGEIIQIKIEPDTRLTIIESETQIYKKRGWDRRARIRMNGAPEISNESDLIAFRVGPDGKFYGDGFEAAIGNQFLIWRVNPFTHKVEVDDSTL